MISKRAEKLASKPSVIMEGHLACCENPYSAQNPNGLLNLGIAENRLIDDLAAKALSRDTRPRAEHIHYAPLEGIESLRASFSSFAQSFLNAPEISKEKVVVQSGLSSVCESLAFSLFDEGDEVLLPSPYYTGFKYDFDGRFGVKLVPAPMKGLKHRIEDLEESLTRKTKAILLTSPHNPTGEVLSKEYLKDVADLCKKKNLHLICDEIYALSILDRREHVSILAVEKDYENVHILYGMAKDFGMAGMKTGFYYTRNEKCLKALKAASYFHPVPSLAQALIADFLADHSAVEAFVSESNKRVCAALSFLRRRAPFLKMREPEAGMFFMADFSEMMKSFRTEEDLYNYFLRELGINMTPGQEMGLAQPGHFRICYARPESELAEFATRLEKGLKAKAN